MIGAVAILDACVLYPAALRDFLMTLAVSKLFRARWTEDIHDEWTRHLLANHPQVTPGNLQRTRDVMNVAIPDCLVTGHEKLIDSLSLPDPDDRHVLAAAIKGGAKFIVTNNLKDFPAKVLVSHGIAAIAPDEFVMRMVEARPLAVIEAARTQRARLRKPPMNVTDFLRSLEKQGLRKTVVFLRTHFDQI
jgi:hypothetical protein